MSASSELDGFSKKTIYREDILVEVAIHIGFFLGQLPQEKALWIIKHGKMDPYSPFCALWADEFIATGRPKYDIGEFVQDRWFKLVATAAANRMIGETR